MSLRMSGLTRFVVALLITGTAVIAFTLLQAGPVHPVTVQASDVNSCGAVGTYGYTGFGTVFPGNAAGLPAGTASTNGTLTFDRNGHVTIHEVEVVDGQVVSPAGGSTFEGTLTVNPDCTVTATLPPLPGTAIVGVVVDNGKQIRAMLTIPGVQINFVSTMRVNP